jgi:hypothetical protein
VKPADRTIFCYGSVLIIEKGLGSVKPADRTIQLGGWVCLGGSLRAMWLRWAAAAGAACVPCVLLGLVATAQPACSASGAFAPPQRLGSASAARAPLCGSVEESAACRAADGSPHAEVPFRVFVYPLEDAFTYPEAAIELGAPWEHTYASEF